MKPKIQPILGILAVVLLLSVPAAMRAEASAEMGGQTLYHLILSIIEDPDPVPVVIWESQLTQEAEAGDVYGMEQTGGDDRPDIGRDPRSDYPTVAWARDTGRDRDIAVSQWTGAAWSETVRITTDGADDRDPRVHIGADGTAWVVWWRNDSAQRIYFSRRPAGEAAWGDVELFEVGGRRPSVIRAGAGMILAYERDGAAGGQELVLLFANDDGTSFREVLVGTSRTAPLDGVLHVASGKIWIDWKQADGALAYSVLVGGRWAPPVTVPWDGAGWTSELETRERIRSIVLAR